MIRSNINPQRFFGLLIEHFELLGSAVEPDKGGMLTRISADDFRAHLHLSGAGARWTEVRDALIGHGIVESNQNGTHFYLGRAVRETIMFLKNSAQYMSVDAIKGLSGELDRLAKNMMGMASTQDLLGWIGQARIAIVRIDEAVSGNITAATNALDNAKAGYASGSLMSWQQLRECQDNYIAPIVEIIRPQSEFDASIDRIKRAAEWVAETALDDEIRTGAADLEWKIREFQSRAPSDIGSCSARLSKATARLSNRMAQNFSSLMAEVSVGPADLDDTKTALLDIIRRELDMLSVRVSLAPSDEDLEAAIAEFFVAEQEMDKPRLQLDTTEFSDLELEEISLASVLPELQFYLPTDDAFVDLAKIPEVGTFENAVAIVCQALVDAEEYLHGFGLSITVDDGVCKVKDLPDSEVMYVPIRIKNV